MGLAVAGLMAIGILFVYSACFLSDEQPVGGVYKRQLLWALVGACCYVLFVVADYRALGEISWWLYVVSLVLLVLVMHTGEQVRGVRRWLSFFGLHVQPAELAKLATILYLARRLGRPGLNLRHPKHMLVIVALVAVPLVLVALQPDLGTAAVFLPIAIAMMFVAGVPARSLGIFLLVGVLFLPVGWLMMDDYQKSRVEVFVNPGKDPLGAGWNKTQSEIAVGSGGFFGKGYLGGTQNILGFLPRTVAPTDFIFSVIAEEEGFVGSVLLLLLYAVVLVGCMRTALLGRDKTGRLLCVGVSVMLFCHVFINIAMTIGLMPITGLPLPLISYGGSFLLTTLTALGLVQSVYVRRYRY